jgi:hypothetical protein
MKRNRFVFSRVQSIGSCESSDAEIQKKKISKMRKIKQLLQEENESTAMLLQSGKNVAVSGHI